MSLTVRRASKLAIATAAACLLLGCSEGSQSKPVCGSADSPSTGWVKDVIGKFDVMVVGELHGNQQSAEHFYGIMCEIIARNHRPTMVGIELPSSSVEAARAYFRTSDLDHLEDDSFWKGAKDGRASMANLSLLEKLFELEGAGRLRVHGLDGRVTGKEDFSKMVADTLYEISGTHGGRSSQWILLMGGGHSAVGSGRHSVTDELIARDLRTSVTSLVVDGGESWVCRWGECGVSSVPHYGCQSASPAVSEFRESGLSFTELCIGTVTPSPPAIDILKADR